MFHIIPDAYFKPPSAKQPDRLDVLGGDDVVQLRESGQPALDEQGAVRHQVSAMPVDLVGAEKPDAARTLEKAV